MERGFTLLELVLTMVLVGIMATAGFGALVNLGNGYALGRDLTILSQVGENAMLRITKELTHHGAAFLGASGISLKTTGFQGDVQLQGGNLMLGPSILAEGASALAFTYFDDSGAQVPPTTPLDFVTKVGVQFTLARNGHSRTFSTMASLRH